MKQFTYNNLTTGRNNETIHAETREQAVQMMSEVGYKIEITSEFDPDLLFKEPSSPPVNNNQQTPNTSVQQKEEVKSVFFETNGIKFKMNGNDVFKQEWVEVEKDKKDKYKVVKELKGKSDSVRETDITNDIKLYVKEWVEVEKKHE